MTMQHYGDNFDVPVDWVCGAADCGSCGKQRTAGIDGFDSG